MSARISASSCFQKMIRPPRESRNFKLYYYCRRTRCLLVILLPMFSIRALFQGGLPYGTSLANPAQIDAMLHSYLPTPTSISRDFMGYSSSRYPTFKFTCYIVTRSAVGQRILGSVWCLPSSHFG